MRMISFISRVITSLSKMNPCGIFFGPIAHCRITPTLVWNLFAANYTVFSYYSRFTTVALAKPVAVVISEVFKFNYCKVAVDFSGDIDYITHDFIFLAKLKYEKPTDFNRIFVGFLMRRDK